MTLTPTGLPTRVAAASTVDWVVAVLGDDDGAGVHVDVGIADVAAGPWTLPAISYEPQAMSPAW